MKIHELKVESKSGRKRVGRGIAAGQGKTAGRGTKGQNSRSGGGVRPGFEGGQNPLAKRIPKKRGFKAINPTVYQPVNVSALERFSNGATVNAETLKEAGLINYVKRPVKILGDGELKHKLKIQVDSVSKQAREKIEQAGGTIELVSITKASE